MVPFESVNLHHHLDEGVQTHGGPLGFHLDLAISPFHEPGGKAAAGGSRFSQQFHLCHPTERRHHAPPDTVIKLRCFFLTSNIFK